MRFAMIGAGGLGGFYGAKLFAAGNEVALIARQRTVDAIRNNGLRVIGDTELHLDVFATTDANEIGEVDYVFCTPKLHQLPDALRHLKPLVGKKTGVVTLQNGVEAPSIVATEIGENHIMPGVARVFANADQPGVISHRGGPGSLSFGEWDGSQSGRSERLAQAAKSAGIPVPRFDSEWLDVWLKFAFVEPFGVLGAMTQKPIGFLRKELRCSLGAAVSEVLNLATARGVDVPDASLDQIMKFLDAQPKDSTSSLQRDLLAGVPSEFEGQPGAVVRLAGESGVDVPIHDLAYETLKRIAK